MGDSGKAYSKPDLRPFLGRRVRMIIDRPLGTTHPQHSDIVYPVNYGYIPGTISGDNMPVDAYLLSVNEPLAEAEGVVIALVVRNNDNEDKLVVAAGNEMPDEHQIQSAIHFQEKYFDIFIVML